MMSLLRQGKCCTQNGDDVYSKVFDTRDIFGIKVMFGTKDRLLSILGTKIFVLKFNGAEVGIHRKMAPRKIGWSF